jgi:hypothetical protein
LVNDQINPSGLFVSILGAKGGISVTLTQFECKVAELLGTARRGAGNAAGKFDNLVAKDRMMEHEIQGVAAEIAFAKHYNLYPCLDTVGIKPGSADFVLWGKTVDVKQSSIPNARLIVPPDKLEKSRSCDIYVLVTGKTPYFIIRGHARRADLAQEKNLVTLRSLVYALSIDQLRAMP